MRTPQRPGARRNARSHQCRPRTAPPWSDGRITMEITMTDADGFDRLSQHADLVIVLISRADIEAMRGAGAVELLAAFPAAGDRPAPVDRADADRLACARTARRDDRLCPTRSATTARGARPAVRRAGPSAYGLRAPRRAAGDDEAGRARGA